MIMHVDDKNIAEITVKFNRDEIQAIIFQMLKGLGFSVELARETIALALGHKQTDKLNVFDEEIEALIRSHTLMKGVEHCLRFFQQYIHNYSKEADLLCNPNQNK